MAAAERAGLKRLIADIGVRSAVTDKQIDAAIRAFKARVHLAPNAPTAALFDALYEIMRQTHTLMYWTGSRDMITADPSIAEHLPPDYIEIYGMPALVHSGADILAEIAKT